MKGLFVKDLKLMMLQKNFLLLILAIVIGMMIFTDDVIFPLGFLSFIVSLFTVSTISYDDFDNGNAFLFTLPITRNHYVSEKYFLGLLLGCMAWVLATVLGIITTVLKDTLPITDLVQSSLMILPIMIGLVGMLGYTSVCIASPMAWFGACALLIPCYYRMMKVWKKDK